MITLELEVFIADDEHVPVHKVERMIRRTEVEHVPQPGQGLWLGTDRMYFGVQVVGWVFPNRGKKFFRAHIGRFTSDKVDMLLSHGFRAVS